jgi:U3 small nucleolar RNA-associated protein 5
LDSTLYLTTVTGPLFVFPLPNDLLSLPSTTPKKKAAVVGTKRLKESGSINFVGATEGEDDDRVLPILFARATADSLQTVRGSLLRPKFEILPSEELEIEGAKELLRKGESVRALLSTEDREGKNKRKDDTEPVVLRGDDGAEPSNIPGADVFDEDLELDEPERTTGGDLPLGERLKSLNLAAPSASAAPTTAKPQKLPAASLLALLTQALRTSDPALLESCLATAHLPTIRATLTKLPTPWILPLLSALESRIRAKPARTRGLLPWLRTAMIVHAGYLVSHPSIPPRLASLESLLRSRLGIVSAMYGLLGRLEVAMSAVGRREERGEMDEEEGMAVFREDEDEAGEGEAEGDWAEGQDEEDAFAEVRLVLFGGSSIGI